MWEKYNQGQCFQPAKGGGLNHEGADQKAT